MIFLIKKIFYIAIMLVVFFVGIDFIYTLSHEENNYPAGLIYKFTEEKVDLFGRYW